MAVQCLVPGCRQTDPGSQQSLAIISRGPDDRYVLKMGPEIGPCVPVMQAERMRCFSDEAADELSSRAGSSHSDRQAADESSLTGGAGHAPGRMRIVARLARQATGDLRDRFHSMSLGCTVPIHGRMTRLCGIAAVAHAPSTKHIS